MPGLCREDGSEFDITKRLIERLESKEVLCRIVGFLGRVPLNATFSRAFHGFLPDESARRIHEALKSPDPGAIVIDSSMDAIAIDGREKAVKSPVSLSSEGRSQPGRR